MSLSLTRGSTVLSPLSPKPREHREGENADGVAFSVELTPNREVLVKTRGGAIFLRVDFKRSECTMDVLNVPHVDVSKKRPADPAVVAVPPVKKKKLVHAPPPLPTPDALPPHPMFVKKLK